MFTTPDPLRPYLALIRVGLWCALAGFLFVGGCRHGQSRQESKTSAVQTAFDTYRNRMVELTAKVAASAERARQQYNDKSAEAARNYADGRKSAENRESVVAADLRAGNLRLRSEWAACMSATRKDPTGPVVGGDDAVAPVPAEAVARVLRVGDDADNHVRWLQAQLMAARALAESCGVVQ